MEITLGSLFDGIAGFPEAGRRVGITTLWASKIEPFCIKVTKTRFSDMKHYGDITKINGAELEPVDIITGGSPCQDLSVAGKRAGLAGERSGLFMEMIRIVREMRNADMLRNSNDVCSECDKRINAATEGRITRNGIYSDCEDKSNEKSNGRTSINIRPRFMVWENVPGAFNSNFGEDFWAVLEEIAKIADETVTIPEPSKNWDKKHKRWKYIWNTSGCILGNDWSIAWRVLDAQYWGVPQRRRRIYLVADFGGQSAPEVLFKREGLRRHIEKGGEAREGVAADAERGTGKTIPINTQIATRGNKLEEKTGFGIGKEGDPAFTLQEAHSHAVFDARGGGTKTGLYCVRTANTSANGHGIADNVAHTLDGANGQAVAVWDTRGNGDGKTSSCITGNHQNKVTDYTVVAVHQNADGEVRQNKVANTLNTNSNASGRNAPLIAGTVPSKWAKGTGDPAGDECQNLVTTVDCRNLYENHDKSATLQSKTNGGQSLNYQNPVRIGYSVRRLTPLECERLQDFPDGWTDIPGASDSARYKALGNSIAVCCAEYVLEGIKEVMGQ